MPRYVSLLIVVGLVTSSLFWQAQGQDKSEKLFPVPETTPPRTDVKPFEYIDVGKKIPDYRPGKGQGMLNKMQVPLAAEESLKHVVLPKGFHAELFAADPQIRRPICMNWDERGRLWIAESVDYPNNLQPEGKGNDRIVICEDTDGDGKADKFTVFADKLSIPTGFTFHKGGILVFEGRKTIYLKDTDGDDVADVREVKFGNWGLGDTHGGVSNMQYGLDNWIWAMQGYNDSSVTVGGETHRFRQGFFRFKPDCSKLEFVRSTNNNTWGLGISEEGLIFGSTANGNPSIYMPIANRYYEAVKGWTPSLVLSSIADSNAFKPVTDKVRQVDWHGGYTAAAGHALYTARTYPQEYWNRTAFVAEPTGHLVGTFVLRRDGSDFHSSNPFNLMASDDEWTAPIMAEVGPDGNVWVIDWYNYIVQHNPTPAGFKNGKGNAYESDLRDKKHGRIYRIVADASQGKVAPKMSLKGATGKQLVAALKHENMFWRKHAQRLLVQGAGLDVGLPDLFTLVRDETVDAVGLNVGAIHALWTLHGLGVFEYNPPAQLLVYKALKHSSAGVRRNAVQVLPYREAATAAILKAGLTEDSDAQVRLAALLALADLPPSREAGPAIAKVLNRPVDANDRWIPDAVTCAAANNSRFFLAAVSTLKNVPQKLLTTTTIVAEHYARGGPVDSVAEVLGGLADGDRAVAEAAVRGLAKGWPASKQPDLTPALEKSLAQLAINLSAGQRAALAKLASGWGSKALAKSAAEIPRLLLAKLADDSISTDERISAAKELIDIQPNDKKAPADLLEIITPRTPPELAVGILQALRASQTVETGRLIVERLPSFGPSARAAGIGVVLSRPEWIQAFLDKAEKGKLFLSELALDQKQALANHPNADIRNRAVALLKRGGALPNADRQKVLDELLPITKEKGDAAAGKLVFKNVCAKCHVHGGEGQRIGPDLTGMAVHTKEHLLVDIIDPSRNVEGNFRVYIVTTTKGLVLTGLLASESKTAIELFDAEGKKQTLLREHIESLSTSARSLMPDGFEKQLSRKDLTDLLEFLTQRGKYLPLVLDKTATAISTRGMFYKEEATTERLIFDDWKPKTFAGVPFHLVDPQGESVPNVVMLYGPIGKLPPTMPKSVNLPVNSPARAIHFLSGVSGWGYPVTPKGTVSLIVRLHYEDSNTEDHPLKNGEHFADYVRRIDVPDSKFAFDLHGRQIRYLTVQPRSDAKILRIELVKGNDVTAPIVMAVTVETRE